MIYTRPTDYHIPKRFELDFVRGRGPKDSDFFFRVSSISRSSRAKTCERWKFAPSQVVLIVLTNDIKEEEERNHANTPFLFGYVVGYRLIWGDWQHVTKTNSIGRAANQVHKSRWVGNKQGSLFTAQGGELLLYTKAKCMLLPISGREAK